jgi:hypothetical protein
VAGVHARTWPAKTDGLKRRLVDMRMPMGMPNLTAIPASVSCGCTTYSYHTGSRRTGREPARLACLCAQPQKKGLRTLLLAGGRRFMLRVAGYTRRVSHAVQRCAWHAHARTAGVRTLGRPKGRHRRPHAPRRKRKRGLAVVSPLWSPPPVPRQPRWASVCERVAGAICSPRPGCWSPSSIYTLNPSTHRGAVRWAVERRA